MYADFNQDNEIKISMKMHVFLNPQKIGTYRNKRIHLVSLFVIFISFCHIFSYVFVAL